MLLFFFLFPIFSPFPFPPLVPQELQILHLSPTVSVPKPAQVPTKMVHGRRKSCNLQWIPLILWESKKMTATRVPWERELQAIYFK